MDETRRVELPVLYFGTPVALITTVNPDGSSNISPISSAWALGDLDRARAWLAERGYDPLFGARPLRRLIQSEIQDRLAMALLSGGVHDGDLVRVDVAVDGSQLVLTSSGPAPADPADDDVIEAELLD